MLVLIGVLCWMFIGIYFLCIMHKEGDNSADQCAEKKEEGWGGVFWFGRQRPAPSCGRGTCFLYVYIFFYFYDSFYVHNSLGGVNFNTPFYPYPTFSYAPKCRSNFFRPTSFFLRVYIIYILYSY